MNGGEDPALVTFSSNYWDLANFAVTNATILQSESLESKVLNQIERNLSQVLSNIEVNSSFRASNLYDSKRFLLTNALFS